MKRYSWFTVVFIFFAICCLNCNVFAAKELYDDFEGTYIDGQKWKYREVVREIVAGKLVSKIGNDSGTGLYRNDTPFRSPESISVIKCDITVVATNLDDGTNSKSFARVDGRFYNTLDSGTEKGDIWAALFIGDRGSGLEAWWEVWESLDDEGDSWEEKGSGALIVPGLTHGHSYTVKLEYNEEANQFTFEIIRVDDNDPPFKITFTGPARQGTEFLAYKGLETGVSSDGGSGIGYASTLFDNVYINNETTAYDTFDSAPLDNDNWDTLETVREIYDGKLRMNVHAEAAKITQYEGLMKYNTSYLEAEIEIKSDTWLSSDVFGDAMAFAKISGWFYNDSHGPGSGNDYNQLEGNVTAQTDILLYYDDIDVLRMVAVALVARSNNSDSSSHSMLYRNEYEVPIQFDVSYTLSIEFTDSKFTFKCEDNENPLNKETLNYSIVSPAYKPYNEGRYLSSRVYADGERSGYVKAEFDNVHIAEAVAFCEGDFGNDGDVDGSDLAIFAADFGRTDCNDDCKGDFDFDGDVDGSDLAVFAADFGRTDCYKIQRHGGLMAYYPFNGNADDESENGNHGTVNGATLTTDRSGNENSAYNFDGDDNIDLGTGLGLVNNAANLTIAAWIYPYEVSTSGTWRQYTILGERNEGDNYQFAVMDNALYFSFWTNGSESMLFGNEGQIEPDTWYFVAVTYDGSLVKFYINGELDRAEWASGNIDGHNSTLFVGTYNDDNQPFVGKIDDIRIFNCALTEWEIQELFNE